MEETYTNKIDKWENDADWMANTLVREFLKRNSWDQMKKIILAIQKLRLQCEFHKRETGHLFGSPETTKSSQD